MINSIHSRGIKPGCRDRTRAVSGDREPVQNSCSTSLLVLFSTGNTEGRIQVTIVQHRSGRRVKILVCKNNTETFLKIIFFMLRKSKTDHLSSSTESLIYDNSLKKKTQIVRCKKISFCLFKQNCKMPQDKSRSPHLITPVVF